MKIYFLLLSIIILSRFSLKQENKYIPSNLKESETVIIRRTFKDWKNTINGNPKSFDLYAQNRMFIEYTETLDKLEQVFKKTGVKYMMVPLNETMNTNSSHLKFDYKLNCKGGEKENDWWICSGGFYFTDLKTGHEYEMIAPDQRAIKEIKKGIKKGN